MRLKNTTTIPNETIREVVRFCLPSGVRNFDVRVTNHLQATPNYPVAGKAYWKGCSLHETSNPFIIARVEKSDAPAFVKVYQYGHLKGKRYWLANRVEKLVYVVAHELRHLWQAKAKNKAGYNWGSRGRFSEIDTESYAISKLQAWRKAKNNPCQATSDIVE